MEKLVISVLREEALNYCLKNVKGWSELSEVMKEWYPLRVIRLFLEDKEFKRESFGEQIN